MLNKKLRILVTGPQGSGKTTQAKLLSETLDIPFIGIGEVLRQRVEQNDEIGIKIKEGLDKGGLVDDAIVAGVAKEKVNHLKGFVMDGYPRSIHQEKLFDPSFNKVFYLEIPDFEVVQRLLRRGRVDDNPELIKERLEIYHQQTEPMLENYRQKGILNIVDGTGTIEEVKGEIEKIANG